MILTTKAGYEYKIRNLHTVGIDNPRFGMEIYNKTFNCWDKHEISVYVVESFCTENNK